MNRFFAPIFVLLALAAVSARVAYGAWSRLEEAKGRLAEGQAGLERRRADLAATSAEVAALEKTIRPYAEYLKLWGEGIELTANLAEASQRISRMADAAGIALPNQLAAQTDVTLGLSDTRRATEVRHTANGNFMAALNWLRDCERSLALARTTLIEMVPAGELVNVGYNTVLVPFAEAPVEAPK